MAVEPSDLFDQAERLLASFPSGAPREADLRRAVSSTYYGLFHFTLTAVADEFVGAPQRATARYVLLYRSIDHRALRELSVEAMKPRASNRYAPYVPHGGFDPKLVAFSATAVGLQGRRLAADYNPIAGFTTKDAGLAIATARDAIRQFGEADEEHRKIYLSLLLCPPRQG